MNKLVFRLLVVIMSLSLLGIIMVQVYWFNNSLENSDEQFRFHVKQVMGNVADKLVKNEQYTFYNKYNDNREKSIKNNNEAEKIDLLEYGYYQRNSRTNETIIYSNTIASEDYDVYSTFFDKNKNKKDSVNVKNYTAKRKTEIFNNNTFDNTTIRNSKIPDVTIEKEGNLDILESAQFEIAYKDQAALLPIQDRVTVRYLQKVVSTELNEYGVKTPFEFNVTSNGMATKIRSENFKIDKNSTYSIPIFVDNENVNKYQLLLTFPYKRKFLFSEIVAITVLSIIFTLLIIVAYANALHQLIKQRQISEIKTDFINNMTHEFKTPIATINLALDAIKNPKYNSKTDQGKAISMYKVVMDTIGRNKQGINPLKPYLAKINAVTNLKELQKLLADMEQIGGMGFIGIGVGADEKNSNVNAVSLYPGSLGLPDKDYYNSDDKDSKEKREKYKLHVARMLQFLGESPEMAMTNANRILNLEIAMSKPRLDRVERRDSKIQYNRK